MDRRAKARAETGIYLLIVAAILILGNFLSTKYYVKKDMTEAERFTLSKGSKRLVSEGLKQPLTIDFYVTRGLAKHDVFIQDVSDLLKEYEVASAGKLSFSVVEPKTEEEKEVARKANLKEDIFDEGSQEGKDQATLAKGFMGMIFKYGSEQDSIEYLPPEDTQGLEFWVTNKIREIRDRADKVEQKFGLVTGKDEIKLTDANLVPGQQGFNLKGVFDQYLPFYKFEDVDLQGGEAEINPELTGILITQPAKDYTEKELRRIDQFVMRGKALVVIAGAVNMKAADPSMRAELNTHGLEKLTEGYGIEMKKEAVIDWDRVVRFPVSTQQGRATWVIAPGQLNLGPDERFDGDKQLIDQSFIPFFRLPEIAFPFPSTLVPHKEKQPEVKEFKVVARSTDSATVDGSDAIDFSPKLKDAATPKGELGQRAIAIALEGTITSAFAGKGDAQGVDAPGKSTGYARVLVISAPQFLANPFARAGNAPPMPPQMQMMGQMGGDRELQMFANPYAQQFLGPTIITFKNTLDWMSGDSDLVATGAKLLGAPKLTYGDIEKPKPSANPEEAQKAMETYRDARSSLQKRIQWTLTLLPALLFAAFGIIRWRMRESARDSITL